MSFSLLWLPQVLRAAGLTVIEEPGWQNRGHGDVGKMLGVLCHHNCGAAHGDMPQGDIDVLVHGRPGLAGPLCNLGLGRSGTWRMIAAGEAWHAGIGAYPPSIAANGGNAHLIGIEAENVGDGHDPWPAVQMDSYQRGCAAILRHIGAGPQMCIGHKEYALPKGRKDDPAFDMAAFRADVAKLMLSAPAQAPAPVAPPAASGPAAAPAKPAIWDQGEHEGCGKDTERAVAAVAAARPSVPKPALTPQQQLDADYEAAAAAAAAEDKAAAKGS